MEGSFLSCFRFLECGPSLNCSGRVSSGLLLWRWGGCGGTALFHQTPGEWCEVWTVSGGGDAPHGRGASYQNGGDGIHQEAPRSSTLEPELSPPRNPGFQGFLVPQQERQCCVQQGLLNCGLPEPKATPLRPVCISLSLFLPLPLPALCLQRNRL